LSKEKITYAGRLDPLAHGVLLLLKGEAIKKKEGYLALQKTYRFTVILGIRTDTYDLLGYLRELSVKETLRNDNIIVNTFVKNNLGKQLQSYPPFSSKTVDGRPLFLWAKEGLLNEIIIPQKEIEIFSFSCEAVGKISAEELYRKVTETIPSVTGDFRQADILKRWAQFFAKNKKQILPTVTFEITCSSGTYVRGLAQKLGEEIGCGAIALDIFRTKIGDYSVEDVTSFSTSP
jgi:tRNA pseudouridine55 synthase